MRRPLTRRAVLAGGAHVAGGAGLAALAAGAGLTTLTGCSGSGEPRATTPKPEDPEHVLARELIADKERTIGLYTTLITSGGAKAGKLAPFRERHEAHLAELRRRFPEAAKLPTRPPTTPPSPPPKVSLTRLRDVERKAAALRPRQLTAASPAFAQLIASIGACEALHVLSLPRSL
ncbi:hypothetical protein ACIBEJ_21310 [Nonomuraea sp. NPDC050790]|uniref:hypothetical protein n=1 Tax=Nonomuraea sp. NPDC050790 TaxID=3364371 RepID=UPI0037886699